MGGSNPLFLWQTLHLRRYICFGIAINSQIKLFLLGADKKGEKEKRRKTHKRLHVDEVILKNISFGFSNFVTSSCLTISDMFFIDQTRKDGEKLNDTRFADCKGCLFISGG